MIGMDNPGAEADEIVFTILVAVTATGAVDVFDAPAVVDKDGVGAAVAAGDDRVTVTCGKFAALVVTAGVLVPVTAGVLAEAHLVGGQAQSGLTFPEAVDIVGTDTRTHAGHMTRTVFVVFTFELVAADGGQQENEQGDETQPKLR
jgi:hypothetical protein